MKRLDDHGILEETGKELIASKQVPIYTVDKNELRRQVIDSEMYKRERGLWRNLLNKAGDF